MIKKKYFSLFLLSILTLVSHQSIAQKEEKQFNNFFAVYNKYISGVRGNSCPMYPSCSRYSIESFKKKGMLMGLMLTPDRLLRCGHEYHYYENIFTEKGLKKYDAIDDSEDHLIYHRPFLNYAYVDTSKHKSSLKLIKKLINNSFYSEALLELNRVFVEDENIADREVFVNYLICLDALGKQEKAIYEYEVNFPSQVKYDEEIFIQLARIWKHLDNRTKEVHYLLKADSLLKMNNNISNSITLGVASAYVNLEDWNRAENVLKEVDSINTFQYKTAQRWSKLIKQYDKEKFKKPTLGALYNVVPGMGYLYAKHKSTAISAFVLNSLLIYATTSNIKKENYGMASLTGVFSLAFYISGMVGGKKSVNRYNKTKLNKYKSTINYNY